MPAKRLPPPKRGDLVVISMRLPRALVTQLDKLAQREERSRAKMIEIATRTYVESKAA